MTHNHQQIFSLSYIFYFFHSNIFIHMRIYESLYSRFNKCFIAVKKQDIRVQRYGSCRGPAFNSVTCF